MNKVLLIGRLTKDIELKKTQSATAYARFILAVNRRFKQEGQPDADFINCVAWKKTAEVMYQHLRKGSHIAIEGRIQTGSYDKDGQRVYTTEVVVENFEFLESKKNTRNYQPEPEQPEYYDDYRNDNEPDPMLDIQNNDLPF